jgi:hypothetical protein
MFGTEQDAGAGARPGRVAEFVVLYLGAPLGMALFLPPSALFPALFALTALGLVLLALTPGFRWRELAEGWGAIDWRHVGVVGLATAAGCTALVLALAPGQFLRLPRTMPDLWLAIMVLYPLLSALPQEVIFRPLFFRRYGALFPSAAAALGANALLFGLAHLMFWNPVAVGLSAVGGLIFAHGYLARGGFPMAVTLHAVCGGIVFTGGLGRFFYHGAV